MIWIPAYFKTVYDLNRERGRYVLTICPPGFTRTPDELLVEQRQSDVIRADADLILRGVKTEAVTTPTAEGVGGRAKRQNQFFTGLLPTGYVNVYDGNVLTKQKIGRAKNDWLKDKTVKNYLLIRFSPDASTLTLLYFPGYRPYPNDRTTFVQEIMGRGLL